jgi:hypothetical protein
MLQQFDDTTNRNNFILTSLQIIKIEEKKQKLQLSYRIIYT